MPMWDPGGKYRDERGRRKEVSERNEKDEERESRRTEERDGIHQAGSKTNHPTPADPSAAD